MCIYLACVVLDGERKLVGLGLEIAIGLDVPVEFLFKPKVKEMNSKKV